MYDYSLVVCTKVEVDRTCPRCRPRSPLFVCSDNRVRHIVDQGSHYRIYPLRRSGEVFIPLTPRPFNVGKESSRVTDSPSSSKNRSKEIFKTLF